MCRSGPSNYTWPRYTIPSTLWQFGGGVINEDVTKATLDSPESVAAVQYWHDLMYKYYVAPRADSRQHGRRRSVRNDMLAAMWEGTWTAGHDVGQPGFGRSHQDRIRQLAGPRWQQAVKMDAHIMSVPTGVDDAGIAKAKTLMTYLANNGAFWATSGQVPAKIAVQSEAEVQAIPSVAMAAEQFNEIGRTDFSHPAFIEIQTAWETAVGNALASAMPMSPRP